MAGRAPRKPAHAKQPRPAPARALGPVGRASSATLPPMAGPAIKLSLKKAANDPRFKRVMDKLQRSAASTKQHPPAGQKAAEAQAAALPPANEKLSGAKAAQVGVMNKAETGKPDPNSFLTMLRAAIEKAIPKKTEGAKDFMKGDDKSQLKDAMTGKVSAQKDEAARGVKSASDQAPDPNQVPGKEVTPMPGEPAPAAPPVGAADAMPAPRQEAEVSLDQGKKDADRTVKDADLTDGQLTEANDSRFSRVVTQKQQVNAKAQSLPQKYRSDEKGVIAGAAAKAVGDEKKGLAGAIATKRKSGLAVKARQLTAKEKDELKRKEVAKNIEGIYNRTKEAVDKKLANLETEVGDVFDSGTEAALNKMRDYVDTRFDDRYSGLRGKARWLKDKFVTLPASVKAWFDESRKVFIEELDKLVVLVANLVETRLKEAKDLIANGEKEISNYVATLPADLKAVGKAAQTEMAERFEEMRRGVDDKKQDLAQNLAQRYKEAIDKGDAALKEMKDAHKSLVEKLKEFVGEVIEVLRNFKNRLMGMLKKGKDAIGLIVAHPIKFLENLLSAIKLGISQFVDHIWEHLKAGFLKWLFGSLADTGITMPKDLSLPSILMLVLQVLGLTYDRLRAKAVKLIGERNVALIEKVFEFIKVLWNGGPAALWEKLKEFLGDLKQQVIDSIQDWLIATIIKKATIKLVTMFNPVGAIIQAILMIYDTVMFFIENINRILDFVEAVISSFYKIATGNIGEAANWIEKALANTIPIIIGFLARLLGISGITDKIVGTIKKIQSRVDKAVDKVIDKIVGGIKKLFAGGKQLVKTAGEKIKDFIFPKLPFLDARGKTHTLTVDKKANKGELVVQGSTSPVAEYLYNLKPKVEGIADPTDKKDAQKAYTDALAQRKKAADTLDAVFVPQSGRTKPEQELFKETNILLNLIKKIWTLLGVPDLLKDEAEVASYSDLGTNPTMTGHHVPQNAILKRLRRWLNAYLNREPVPGFREHMKNRLAGLGVKHDAVGGYADSQGICIRMEKQRHNQTRSFGKLPEDLDIPQGEFSVKGKQAGDERIKKFVRIAASEFNKDTEDVFAIYSGRKGQPKVKNIQKITASVQKLRAQNASKWGTFLK